MNSILHLISSPFPTLHCNTLLQYFSFNKEGHRTIILEKTNPSYQVTWCQVWPFWNFAKKKKEDYKPFTTLRLIAYPRLWALTINLFTSPPGEHSSWGGSLLCSLFAWQGNKTTFSLFFKTLSLYFYLALVHRQPRFWQQNLFFLLKHT